MDNGARPELVLRLQFLLLKDLMRTADVSLFACTKTRFLPVVTEAEWRTEDMQALFWTLRAHRLPLLCVAICSTAVTSLLQRKPMKQTSDRKTVTVSGMSI